MSIHHASGPHHLAHSIKRPCPLPGSSGWLCAEDPLSIGDDNKCDWCRELDRRVEDKRGCW